MQKDFSRPLIVADLPLSIQRYQIKVEGDDLKALAKILKVEGIKFFAADISLKINKETHILDVWGNISAKVVLKSVISLENFNKKYNFGFSDKYAVAAAIDFLKEEEKSWDSDLPNIIIDGKIDLMDIAIEQIALQLDDYPRKDGEVFKFYSEFSEEDSKNNPFEILSSLKK
jgi:uncharacterized metal-binding protein YceD (DUF177 family)